MRRRALRRPSVRRTTGPPGPALAVGVLAAAALLPATGLAQETNEAGDGLSISTARIDDYPRVSVTVDAPLTVIETDVPAEAFTLTEDGQERDVEVQRLRSEDLEVALLMDTSGSMEGVPIAAARDAALEFTARMPPGVSLSLIEFNTDVTVISGFTTDREETDAALRGMTAGGWTSLYDALHAALDLFEGRDATRQAIVVLTDGGDNRSTATLEETVERLAGGDEVLHIVELITADRPDPDGRQRFGREGPDVDEVDLAALDALAAAAGQGTVLSPADLDALTATYQDIASTLMNQYELTYTSQAHVLARLTVRLEHGGVVAEGSRDVELPGEPRTEPDPEPELEEPEPDPVEPEPDEPETVVAAEPRDPTPLPPGWAVLTAIGVLVAIGVIVAVVREGPLYITRPRFLRRNRA